MTRILFGFLLMGVFVPCVLKAQHFTTSPEEHDTLVAQLRSLSQTNPKLYRWLSVALSVSGDNILGKAFENDSLQTARLETEISLLKQRLEEHEISAWSSAKTSAMVNGENTASRALQRVESLIKELHRLDIGDRETIEDDSEADRRRERLRKMKLEVRRPNE